MITDKNDPINVFEYSVNNEFGQHSTAINYGLTKREYFAAMAMQGRLSSWPSDGFQPNHKELAEASVQIADALINELNKTV